MKLLDNIYVYPWTSYEANNCNTVFIAGPVPPLIAPGHRNLLGNVINGMARDGRNIESVRLVMSTHSHPDHIEGADAFDGQTLRAIGRFEFDYLNGSGKDLYLMTGCEMPRSLTPSISMKVASPSAIPSSVSFSPPATLPDRSVSTVNRRGFSFPATPYSTWELDGRTCREETWMLSVTASGNWLPLTSNISFPAMERSSPDGTGSKRTSRGS
jgi:hypothetical protein